MSETLDEFNENRLNNLISNISLFNTGNYTNEINLKKAIKSDSKALETKYAINITINIFEMFLDVIDKVHTDKEGIIKYMAGFDLHSQLVLQGLGDYINHFSNIFIDLEGKSLKDEFGNPFVKFNGFCSVEFIYIPDLEVYVNSNSILEKIIDDKIFKIYIVNKKFLYVDITHLKKG